MRTSSGLFWLCCAVALFNGALALINLAAGRTGLLAINVASATVPAFIALILWREER